MKLIKKIAAIMFAFMMVVSMSCNVKADEGTTPTTGTITIDNAKNGETYTIYQVLTLESSDVANGLYSYTPANNAWEAYFKTEEGKKYMTVDDNGYVTTKYTETNAQELAQALIKQAKTINYNPQSKTADKDGTIEFTGLALGYYVVDTTVGTLCGLNTANPEVTIKDKNDKPTVDKKIDLDGTNFAEKNSVNIGDHVSFKTTINVKPGAKNYILHDTMDSHLKYIGIYHVEDNLANLSDTTDFVVKTSGFTDDCTFEISFTEAYYAKNRENIDTGKLTQIYIQYGADVKDDAVINESMKNTTHLTYGDKNTESNKPETTTQTFGIPVFKCTKDNTALEGAEFILTTVKNDESTALNFIQKNDKYRFDTTGATKLTSLANGHIDIEGIKAGTYYLQETKAPKGYNLLKNPVTIKIDSEGKIYVDKSTTANTGDVKVENKTGTVLPSTGGAGTTMIYLIGGALVLGSGVVLVSKRRVKGK